MSARVEQFQALVASQPANELFRFSLSQALITEGRDNEAIPHLVFCIQQKADWMLPRILLGKILIKTGRPADARPLLETALQLAIEQDHEDPAEELKAILGAM